MNLTSITPTPATALRFGNTPNAYRQTAESENKGLQATPDDFHAKSAHRGFRRGGLALFATGILGIMGGGTGVVTESRAASQHVQALDAELSKPNGKPLKENVTALTAKAAKAQRNADSSLWVLMASSLSAFAGAVSTSVSGNRRKPLDRLIAFESSKNQR